MSIGSCPTIHSSILGTIGATPVVELRAIPRSEAVFCRILAKCEFFNPGGSVKDRIALRMIEEAEKTGRLVPGVTTIIEPTSGNTGIGLSMIAACRGYKVIVTMPQKMSAEKSNVMKALGATVIRTPTNVPHDHPESHISSSMPLVLGLAKRLESEIPNSVVLDQYNNQENPRAHEYTTAEEILEVTENGSRLDMLVLGSGTGGTVSGIGKRIKKIAPHVKIIAVDPIGSVLAGGASGGKKMYQVEGIGYDFIPSVLDGSVIDEWFKVSDRDSFRMARRLLREEGIMCGGSSGSVVHAAMIVAKRLHEGQTAMVILPDSAKNYSTKFLRDEWMDIHRFSEELPKIHLDTKLEDYSETLTIPILAGEEKATECIKMLLLDASPVVGMKESMIKEGDVSYIESTELFSLLCDFGPSSGGTKLRDLPFQSQDDFVGRLSEKKLLISSEESLRTAVSMLRALDGAYDYLIVYNKRRRLISCLERRNLMKVIFLNLEN